MSHICPNTLNWLSCKLTRLQLLHLLFFGFFLFMCFCYLWLFCLVSPSCVSYHYDFVLFLLHLFLTDVVFSCFFFMHFFPLWLCLVSTLCVSCHYDFVLFLCAFPAVVVLHGFSTIYWVGLADPIYFLFSSFIHYIGLGMLTHLLSLLFIYTLHWVGLAGLFTFLSLYLFTTLGWIH